MNSSNFNTIRQGDTSIYNGALSGNTTYGMDNNSLLFYNNNAQPFIADTSAGFGASANNGHVTIWSNCINSTVCNFQDINFNNSRIAYVNSSGTFTTVSSY